MLEERIVRFCSPTLAGIKTGNLFNSCGLDRTLFYKEYQLYKSILAPLGLVLHLFERKVGNPLVYLFRHNALEKDLSHHETRTFLKAYGYQDFSVVGVLEKLGERIDLERKFPHEIGVFLSYPLEDVKGFIQYGSECCKCTGYWCVYDDEKKAKHDFARYDRCKACYERLYCRGRRLCDLAVATRIERIG